MSGHSRWAGIKHKKAAIDKKRGKIFTKIMREIMVAAKEAGGKPENNPRLRKAIEDAKAVNTPMENVKRAILKGTGELPGVAIEEVTYEGYGPGGVAVFVDATTDNRNRTTSEIRHLFAAHGGNMGENGCVSFMFDVKGLISVPRESVSEDKMTGVAIEVGAEDIKTEGDSYEIYTDPAEFEKVKEGLKEKNIMIENAEITRIPKNTVPLEGEAAEQCIKLMNAFDEHDDVKNASANFDISEEIIDRVSSSQ